jgi:hypothetical protein
LPRGLAAVALAVTWAAGAAAKGEARHALLDVPYLSQTPQLCGGAAVAMVLRYWGLDDVFPQDFAPLVDHSEGGIRTGALAHAVTSRGWHALTGGSHTARSTDWLGSEIDKGRPVIALIEVSPRTFHYVVVVGTTDTEVVYHDPARAPFRVVARQEFDGRWASADRWSLVVLPPVGFTAAAAAPVAVPASLVTVATAQAGPCGGLIAHNVTLARTGQLDDAERGLLAAAAICPSSGLARLELAGVRFLQGRYGDAEELAAESLRLGPDDGTAWELVATSRYLQGNMPGALDAWNQIGRPRADVVHVEGVERLDHPVVVRLTGFEPREVITSDGFGRAVRRLGELPSMKQVGLTFQPRADGAADVRAALVERAVLPQGALGWAAVGVNAGFRREVRIPVSSPFGQGETWDIRYRWAANRPRVRVVFNAPSPDPLPGVFGVEALWERQTYELTADPLRAERRRLGLHVADWLTSRMRWSIGGAADQFDTRRYLAVDGQLDTRWLDDHVATLLSLGYWTPTNGARPFTTAHGHVAWRSTRVPSVGVWSARAGVTAAGRHAPLAVWPIAGSGESRGPLLRGHALHDGGIVVSDVFGRRLAFAAAEYQHPVYERSGASVGVAGFVDIARSWQRPLSSVPSPLHVDVGGGLRIGAPGADDEVRIDVGYGVRDGRAKFSAGYVMPWGR